MGARRQRPVWLATALTFLSGGLYEIWWFGATWAEIKRETGDSSMRPGWHALTSLVPVYASFRSHAHFRSLAQLLRAKAPDSPDRAAWAAWIVSLAWASSIASLLTSGIIALILSIATSGLYATFVYQGQSDFNRYIRASGGEPTERAHAMEIVGLVIAVFI